MSEQWERGEHPGQAEVHEPIISDEQLWEHEMVDEGPPDEAEEVMISDLETTYLWLNQLREDLIEACYEAETHFGEEIDRNNLRELMRKVEVVDETISLLREIEDPRESRTEVD